MNKRGSTLIVVLVALGFISFLSLILVEYALWRTNLSNVNRNLIQLHEAQRLAESSTRSYLERTLPDSPVLPPEKTLEWTLPPGDISVTAKVKSLNAKISLNRFKKADATESFRRVVESLLDQLNYPNRAMKELARWIVPPEEQVNLGPGPYGGYDYSAPERKILHTDELELVSGFKEIGVTGDFREVFTVYGSGTVNPLHFSPEQWELLESALGDRLPNLPPTALRTNGTLRRYLRQDNNWSEIKEAVPFLSRRDDSFRVDFYVRKGTTRLARSSVYTFNYEEKELSLTTRFPVAFNSRED